MSDIWEVVVYYRAVSIPLLSCLSQKFVHHYKNELQNWKRKGCLAAQEILCFSDVTLKWVAAPVALQYDIQSLEVIEGEQHLTKPLQEESLCPQKLIVVAQVEFTQILNFLPDSSPDESSSGSILHQQVMITHWQLKDFAFWLCFLPEVWHIWGMEGEKCKIWLSSSLSYGNAAAQSIFSTEFKGASPPFEAGEHCKRVVQG